MSLHKERNAQSRTFFDRIMKIFKRKSRTQILQLPEQLHIDVWGLPGDTPGNIPNVLCRIIDILAPLEMVWCIVGDILLAHYCVPKIVFDIEVCVLSEQFEKARIAFTAVPDFCYPFRPRQSLRNTPLAVYPRFRVKGMNQCFCLVPSSFYGLTAEAFAHIMYTPTVLFPLVPLPFYIQGIATSLAIEGISNYKFVCQLEYLIDGVDIDEDWCNHYLSGPALSFVVEMCTNKAKKERMGGHPKYIGNITTYIHDQAERQSAIAALGRTISIESQDFPPSLDTGLMSQNELDPSTIQCMSDLHLECSGYLAFKIAPASYALALLGDIGNVMHEGLFKFLQEQLSRFRKVFFVMGNHEFYGDGYYEAKIRMRIFSENLKRQKARGIVIGEFILLDCTRHDLNETITILGCTLWSSIPPTASEKARLFLRDFKRIKDWTIETHNFIHTSETNWLERECLKIRQEEPNRRIFIFTHHAPLMRGTSAPDKEGRPLASCFATDMTKWGCWGPPVNLWAFGHTHYSCDFIQGGIRIISNQRGYEGIDSQNSFSPGFVLHI